MKEIDFPVLAANLKLEKEPGLASARMLMPSLIKEVDGRKIGIIGYLTPETKEVAGPNEVEFVEEVIAIK